jgi:pectate lyase
LIAGQSRLYTGPRATGTQNKSSIHLMPPTFLLRAAAIAPFLLSAIHAAEPRPDFALVGFATVSAHGLGTTTGGGTAPAIGVRTARELQAALERTDLEKKAHRENTPRVVRIDADSLIGHSSSQTAAALDRGRLNVTLHHNLFENIGERAPRARFGNIHAFNNCVDGAECATLSLMGAATLVERCFYRDCRLATTFSHAGDSVSKGQGGTLLIVESRHVEPRPAPAPDSEREAFELEHNFKSSTAPERFRFNAPADWPWPDLRRVPYAYRTDPVDDVPAIVRRHAGAGKLPP